MRWVMLGVTEIPHYTVRLVVLSQKGFGISSCIQQMKLKIVCLVCNFTQSVKLRTEKGQFYGEKDGKSKR